MGVDAALGETPIDWVARGDRPVTAPRHGTPARGDENRRDAPAPPAPEPRLAPPPAPRAFQAAPPGAAESAARALARGARTLADLEAAIRAFDGCGLKTTAKNTCVYRGAPQARLMIIGEAPGRDEDIAGKPFVGPAGRLLDKMLAAIGMSEADAHITNIVYWRPPGNRTPTAGEALVCRPFLERQIELVAPERLVLLGGAAAKNLLDTPEGIMRIRGTWRALAVAGREIPAMATLHPAYLLRTPAAKRLAWRDVLAVKLALAGSA